MTRAAQPVPFVRRVRIRNFRSIADCDVALGPLTVLLGLNASGKSNFLDALRFAADAVATSPQQAISSRGGLESLLRRAPEPVESFQIQFEFALPAEGEDEAEGEVTAQYGFEIGRNPEEGPAFAVLWEACRVDMPHGTAFFATDADDAFDGPASRPVFVGQPGQEADVQVTHPDTLYLPAAATRPPFQQLEMALRTARFYDLDPEVLRSIDTETIRQSRLGPTGEHLGHVLGTLQHDHPEAKERLDSYIAALIGNALGIDEQREGRYSTVSGRFLVGDDAQGEPRTEVFGRETLSMGTLLAAGVLAALFQPAAAEGRTPLIAIEEPEKALHPATVRALYEALAEASERTQILATSQSSELLESEDADLSHLLVVANLDGVTHIGPVDGRGRAVVERDLMSIGELHRSGQMRPEQVGSPASERG